MGCDIHMVVQVRRDGAWETVKVPNLDYKEGSLNSWEQVAESFRGYSDRNYNVFAMLADVQNGHGFAGCDTGDGFTPIAEPRGFPEDFELSYIDEEGNESDRRRAPEYHQGVWMGEHSYTWVTLAELKNYSWDKTTKLRGWVNGNQLKAMREEGLSQPKEWCGDVFGARVQKVSLEVLDRLVQDQVDGLGNFFAVVEWEKAYKDCAGRFYSVFLPLLRGLGGGDDVRLVMGFDS